MRAPPPNAARPALLVTPPHGCSYLEDRDATTVFIDPDFPMDTRLYSALTLHGFRRSGPHVYRPHCGPCQACVPVRVQVDEFQPRRSQRRAWRRNEDLSVHRCPPLFDDEHFALYRHYVGARHRGGSMDNPTPGRYMEFLTSVWSETDFYEFRLRDRLLAVAVADRLRDGLSAVYTFFDTGFPERSLGVHAVLWQIQEARRLGLHWVYLGYWIADSPKMAYKAEFRPQQHLVGGRWVSTAT